MIAIALGIIVYFFLALYTFGVCTGAVQYGRKENRSDEYIVSAIAACLVLASAAAFTVYAYLQMMWEHLP